MDEKDPNFKEHPTFAWAKLSCPQLLFLSLRKKFILKSTSPYLSVKFVLYFAFLNDALKCFFSKGLSLLWIGIPENRIYRDLQFFIIK